MIDIVTISLDGKETKDIYFYSSIVFHIPYTNTCLKVVGIARREKEKH